MATEADPLLTKNEKEIADAGLAKDEAEPQQTLGENVPTKGNQGRSILSPDRGTLAHGGAARFPYSPHDVISNMFKIRGTVIPCIAKRATFPICIVIYLCTSICKHSFEDECGKHLPRLTVGDLAGTLLPLLTFFLAFFTSECYGRFKQQYSNLRKIEGDMRTIGIQCKANEKFSKEATIELFRYLTAAYYVLFCRLYDGEEDDKFNLKTTLDEGLLTYQETVALQVLPENLQWFKLLSWSFIHVEKTCEHAEIIAREKSEIQKGILSIRETMNTVTYTFQMPVPLAYYHAITVINVVTCLLYSYASSYDKKVGPGIGWLVTLLMLFGFYGMQEVALQLADPFGDDDCDLPVDSYVHSIMNFMQVYIEEDSEEQIGDWNKDFKKVTFWAQGREPDADRVAEQDPIVEKQYIAIKAREEEEEKEKAEKAAQSDCADLGAQIADCQC